jgi:hypothetical protein
MVQKTTRIATEHTVPILHREGAGKLAPTGSAPYTLVKLIGILHHTCHVANLRHVPFGNVLIEHIRALKHCKRGRNKEKKGQPTTNNKKGIVSKYQNKITEHVTEHVRYLSDETRVVVFKIQTY